MSTHLKELFDLIGKAAIVIGGGGYLCSEIVRGWLPMRPQPSRVSA